MPGSYLARSFLIATFILKKHLFSPTSFLSSLALGLSLVEDLWSSCVVEDFGSSDMVKYLSSCIVADLSLSFIRVSVQGVKSLGGHFACLLCLTL